jgi:hypothetical protein
MFRKHRDLLLCQGRAIAQAVSRRVPTAVVRFRSQVRSCGICGGQSGTAACFLRVLRFTLPILTPPIAPHSFTIRSWYNRPASGHRTKWTQSHPTPQNNHKIIITSTPLTFLRGVIFMRMKSSAFTFQSQLRRGYME